jgi:hypothetical protein
MKAFGMFILGLISTTFTIIIILFVLTYFPQAQVQAFAGSLLSAGGAILGAVPDIVDFVVRRFQGA